MSGLLVPGWWLDGRRGSYPSLPVAIDYIADKGLVNSVRMLYMGYMKSEPIYTVKKLLALTPELAERIDAFRFEQRIKSESEAMRLLISRGLAAEGAQASGDAATIKVPKNRKKRSEGA